MEDSFGRIVRNYLTCPFCVAHFIDILSIVLVSFIKLDVDIFFQLMTIFFGSNRVWQLKFFNHLMFICQIRQSKFFGCHLEYFYHYLKKIHSINGGSISTIDAMIIIFCLLPKKKWLNLHH
jgi:hypothetical protein